MKKLLLIIMMFLIPIGIKAETIIDDYKVEITIDKDDIFKVSERFKVIQSEEENRYWKLKSQRAYDYSTNVEDFEENYYENYAYYLRFSLKDDKEYYFNYKVKDKNKSVGDYDYFDFFQIVEHYTNYENVTYNNFQLVIRLEDGRELDLSDIYNYNKLSFDIDGNIIIGKYEGSTKVLDSFEIRKMITKTYADNTTNKMIDEEENKIPINIARLFSLYVPIGALLVNIFFILLYFLYNKSEIDGDKKEKRKKMAIMMIIVTIISYLVSIGYVSIINETYIRLLPMVFIMLFYTPFYCIFITGVGEKDFQNMNVFYKIFAFLFSLFIKCFVVFHSSIFALTIAINLEPFSKGILISYFYMGFIINAINLEMIGIFRRKSLL